MEYEEGEFIDDEIKTAEEIARRSIVLGALISTIYGAPLQDTCSWLKTENLWDELSSEELNYIKNPTDEKLKINLSWRSEALIVLLWSINKIPSLPSLTTEYDTALIKSILPALQTSTKPFVSSAYLRDEEEILQEYEIIYESHWSVRDARINNNTTPKNLNPGVVYERHFGFNYIIGYCSLPWDEITCDT